MDTYLRSIIIVLDAVFVTMALDISGSVINPDGTPRSGVIVGLASGGATATTDASGKWALTGSVGVMSRTPHLITRHLTIIEQRLRLEWGGRDLAGRGSRNASTQQALPEFATRAASTRPDTISYSWGGKIFLRDTISASRDGMIGTYDTTWNAMAIYGWLNDSRDGKIYRTVSIDSQVWMAQNLNYFRVGVCYNKDFESCSKYGRLYNWAEVMNGSSSSTASPSGVNGICPAGWHVPSNAEWQIMLTAVGGGTAAGTKLKSTSGWNFSANGIDLYGFRALPAGYYAAEDGSSGYIGYFGNWWSTTEYSASHVLNRTMDSDNADVFIEVDSKVNRYSLRCAQD